MTTETKPKPHPAWSLAVDYGPLLVFFLVYKFAGSFYAFRTEVLKKKLLEEKQFFREVVGGDAGSNTKMFLVKIAVFKSWGKEI